jgi:hypothetical protein
VGVSAPVVGSPGVVGGVALPPPAAGWGLAYVERVTVHHHPSPKRHSPGRRVAAIRRSRLLTALMRLPGADVLRIARGGILEGPRGWEGLLRALPDVPAALRHRRRIPDWVHADLRRLSTGWS